VAIEAILEAPFLAHLAARTAMSEFCVLERAMARPPGRRMNAVRGRWDRARYRRSTAAFVVVLAVVAHADGGETGARRAVSTLSVRC
jgi:hypothetical protein